MSFSKAKLIFISVFILLNLINGYEFFRTGQLGGDLSGYMVDDYNLLLEATFLACAGVVFCGLLIPSIANIKFKKFLCIEHDIFVKFTALSLLFLSYFFIIKYNVGVSGFSYDNVPQWVVYFNGIINPVYALLIYLFAFVNKRDRFYYSILFISLPLPLIKGFMGFYIYFALLFFIIKKQKISMVVLISGFILILLSPFLRMFKYVVGTGDVVKWNEVYFLFQKFIDSQGLELHEVYYNYLFHIVERFQHVSNIYYIINNSSRYYNDYYNGYFSSFFFEGAVQKFICKGIITACPQFNIQQFSAQYINGMDNWQSSVGFFSWAFIEPLLFIPLILYATLIYIIAAFLSKSIKGSYLPVFTWSVFVMNVGHGWFNDFSNYIMTLLLLIAFWSIARSWSKSRETA